ncbi:CNNM domain-containing protein [Micromonospora echinospora]
MGSELALIASRRTVIEPLAATSVPARWALSATNQIPLMIAGAQLGITVCSLGLGAIAEPALAHLLEPLFHAGGLPAGAVPPVAARAGVSRPVEVYRPLAVVPPD